MHRNPTFRSKWKKDLDISLNAYRKSPDAVRLQEATNGEALAVDNGLYISMADGFQTHESKTQSVTGDCLLLISTLVLLLTCVFYAVVGLASCELSSEYFGRRFNHQPIAIIDLPEPSNTGKVIREFFLDMQSLAERGLWLKDYKGGAQYLHKPFLKGHLADGVAR